MKDVRVNRGKHDGLRAIGSVFWTRVGDVRERLCLSGSPVKPGDFFSSSSIHEFGIERVWRNVAVFNRCNRMPVPEIDFAIVAAAGDAVRSAFLLAVADAVAK